MKIRFKLTIIFLLIIFNTNLSGCRTLSDIGVDNRQKILSLRLGMKRGEVRNIMNHREEITYNSKSPVIVTERPEERNRAFLVFRTSFSKLKNPYSSKFISKGSKYYIIDYYFTEEAREESDILAAELFPLVFSRDINEINMMEASLIGWGREYISEKLIVKN